MFEQISQIVGHLAWPVAILLVVWLLRSEIRRSFSRLESAKFPGGTEFKLFPDEGMSTGFDKDTKTKRIPKSEKFDGNWKNVGDIY